MPLRTVKKIPSPGRKSGRGGDSVQQFVW